MSHFANEGDTHDIYANIDRASPHADACSYCDAPSHSDGDSAVRYARAERLS
jgi:hypothetical protein